MMAPWVYIAGVTVAVLAAFAFWSAFTSPKTPPRAEEVLPSLVTMQLAVATSNAGLLALLRAAGLAPHFHQWEPSAITPPLALLWLFVAVLVVAVWIFAALALFAGAAWLGLRLKPRSP